MTVGIEAEVAPALGYREQISVLPGCVAWSRQTADARVQRILPDGCVDLIFANDTLIVAGPDTVARVAHMTPDHTSVAIRCGPGIGPAMLGVPAAELRDRRWLLGDLWPAVSVRRVADRMHAARTVSAQIAVLEEVIGARLDAAPPDPAMRFAAARAIAGDPVGAVAAEVGLSPRQLQRRCQISFGYGLKTLARIGRLDRALALARSGLPLAVVAHGAGFADQSHFTREVRALAGVPPRELLV
jgi:AraC-like DNA-binding protein